MFEYFGTLTKARAHGEVFAYKTVNTDVLGAVLRRVTGKPLSNLLSERIFARLGAEHDAYFTADPAGAEFAGGGLNLTLRDLARFGEAMRLGGRYNGAQIVPRRVVDDIQRGGNREHFAPAGYATLPGWSYRNMWWVSHDAHGTYMARGIHGQALVHRSGGRDGHRALRFEPDRGQCRTSIRRRYLPTPPSRRYSRGNASAYMRDVRRGACLS